MGGAARGDKRRRQEEATRRLAAAGIAVPPRRRTSPLIMVGGVVFVAVLIGFGVLWYRNHQTVPAPAPTYSASVAGAVVTAGAGTTSIDVYEDFLCPNCERFEQRDGAAITTALNGGRLTVRYHTIAILDRSSNPAGYSTRAANAALCAAAAGIFPTYRAKLFAEQPAEGSAGLSNDQLVAFGTQLGATGDFATCVTTGARAKDVTVETAKAITDAGLLTNGQFGTPTVAANGRKIDINDSSWLVTAMGG